MHSTQIEVGFQGAQQAKVALHIRDIVKSRFGSFLHDLLILKMTACVAGLAVSRIEIVGHLGCRAAIL